MIQPVNNKSFKTYQNKYLAQISNIPVCPFIYCGGGVPTGPDVVSEKKSSPKLVSKTKVKK